MEEPREEQISTVTLQDKPSELRKCFVIMPIADPANYDPGHFDRVFTEIIEPACYQAKFKAEHAAIPAESHKIMTHILKSIISFDMALCDLSSNNPNVFYELAIRQMAKMPVAIIKDDITKNMFDVSNFRYHSYSHSLRSDLVKKDVEAISKAITQTYNNRETITSEFLDDISVKLQIDPKKLEISKGEAVLSEKLDLLLSKISTSDAKHTSRANDFMPDVLGAPIRPGDFYATSFSRGANLPKDQRYNIHLLAKIMPEADCILSVSVSDAYSGISTRVLERIRSGETGYKKLDPNWIQENYPEEYKEILNRAGKYFANR
ncbi:hypothetical protein [Dyadobacter crusticola]|uniref:hypothetical protein n=1 Tax=Dyadobacter crusticola TaxID=292407 RepID=UPI00068F1F8B|nr:hypothetical protein [Dyadobacter crusticola]